MKSWVKFNNQLETNILVFDYSSRKYIFKDKKHQDLMRKTYENPGIIVLENVLEISLINRLREGLENQSRAWKDDFRIVSKEQSPDLIEAQIEARRLILEITQNIFGYDLPKKHSTSYRPMISKDEPMHYDTGFIACGTMHLMSILNFDTKPRHWKTSLSFYELITLQSSYLKNILINDTREIPPSAKIREYSRNDPSSPLTSKDLIHDIKFAPNTLWFANPKAISHQLVFGRGMFLNSWHVKITNCNCQWCLLKKIGLEETINQEIRGKEKKSLKKKRYRG